jgi:hypothetical protein
LFGRISMIHINLAVTLGFLITKHITKGHLLLYSTAEITGALLGSLFVKYAIGRNTSIAWCKFSQLFLSSTINICSRGFRFCFADGSHFNSSPPYKWLERFWRISNWWWHCRFRHILFSIYSRRLHESCMFFSLLYYQDFLEIYGYIGLPRLLEHQ